MLSGRSTVKIPNSTTNDLGMTDYYNKTVKDGTEQ